MRALSLGLICALQTSLLFADIGSAHGGEAGPKAKPEKATLHVLGPGSEEAISKLLNLGEKLSDGSSLNATIQGSSILVSAGPATKPTLRVKVVHTKDAPKGAVRAGDVSIVAKPGPAPAALTKELVSRIKGSKVSLPWQKVVPKPTAEDLKREREEAAEKAKQERLMREAETKLRAKEKMLGRAAQLVELGEMDKAKKLLRMVTDDANNGLNISVAIQLIRAGAKAEAMKVLKKVKDPTVGEALSLKLLRGKLPKGSKALKGVSPKAACDLAMVGSQALDLKRYAEAESLSRAIRKAAPGCVLAWETELRSLGELKSPVATQKERVEEALKSVSNTGSIHQMQVRFIAGGDSQRSIEKA